MGNGDGIISTTPPSYGTAGVKSARIDAFLKAKLEKFKSDNLTNPEIESALSQYEYDIKDGYFTRISQQAPKLYEALLKAGIAPREGVDYNNYQKDNLDRPSIFSEESNKRPTPKTPTEHKQNALTETIMDGYKSLQNLGQQIKKFTVDA